MKTITLSLLFLLVLLGNTTAAQNIVINEILASNSTSIQDEDGSHEDWIELYNKGAVSVNLLGYGISDDALLLYKWTFPSVSIAPGQYLIVWASNKNRSVTGNPLHTNFKISTNGENILLTNPGGVTVQNLPPINLQTDISYGRLPNGTGPYVYFGVPTPNAVNASAGYSGFLSAPVFSQNSGFFTSNFNLTLSSVETGTTILYTLDGSEPNENNLSGTTYSYKNQYPELPGQATGRLLFNNFQTLQYNAPLLIINRSAQANDVSAMSSTYSFNPTYIPSSPVFKSTSVRVKIIKPGFLASKVITKNYFIAPEGVNRFSMPVVSLNLNEDALFAYNNGIYVAGKDFDDWRTANPFASTSGQEVGNYYRRGDNNEVLANMSYFVNGNEVINQEVGLRIRGGATRRFESKSLTIYARENYGNSGLDYRFFNDLPYTTYERLTLSNSGGDFRNTMFRDALNQRLCKELYPEKEAYQPIITFVNGEYGGILNLRERYDNEYFKMVYNTSSVDFLENQSEAQEGDALKYNAMLDYVRNNSLAVTSNFNYIKTQLDPDNFTDYFISNIFFQNSDWPNNNVQYWRNKIPAYNPTAPYGLDGRWRWMYHDMDNTFSFGTNNYNGNTLAIATSVNNSGVNPDWSTLLLRKLLDNNTFKIDFINRFADLLNTSFLSTRIVSTINAMKAVVDPEIAGQISRWKSPEDLNEYNYSINYEINFANARPAFQRNHIRSKFGIAANINAILNVSNPSHGYIKMNTINIADGTPGIIGNPYPWTGIYFKDIPVKLKAIAKPGFVFSNWTGVSTSTDAEITITPSASFSITAVFVPDVVETSVPIYFWMMNGSIANNTPLTGMDSSYEITADGFIGYQSCLTGYPFPIGNPSRNKASMERRNSPTPLNYRPEANGNLAFASSDMKGLQIKQPFQSGGLENTMTFNFSTNGYKKIKFSFTGIDEGAASAISIDYSVNSGAPIWLTSGLAATSLPLTNAFQLFETDFSTITSVNNNANFKIRLRFTGPTMTVDNGARVTFNNIAVDGVKLPLSYPTPNVFAVGTAITSLNPSVTEIMNSYSISPALPNGLIFNTTTGSISGTPTIVNPTVLYTVTASNASGSIAFDVSITVNAIPPSTLNYPSPNVFTRNTAISNLNPTISGGTVLAYSVSPSLPSGLLFNTISGVISGTPTVISATATYAVTAVNSGGSTSFGVVITVNDVAPSSLSYNSPNVFTVGYAIADLFPSTSGNVISYTISPSLPLGLLFNTTSGVISGTPTVISATATYTVTAVNSGGS
ncbi:MAG: CotH kinase family protein, partial [Burkholderiales bacterium]|nr:CotH kinase family protein [Flavobacterium sp.]